MEANYGKLIIFEPPEVALLGRFWKHPQERRADKNTFKQFYKHTKDVTHSVSKTNKQICIMQVLQYFNYACIITSAKVCGNFNTAIPNKFAH